MLPTRGLGKLVVFARICLRTVCKLYKLLHLFNAELFYSWREWQRWRTAGGIQCSFCRHCLKTAQPALSSLRTTPTVWGWVHQVLLATCLWASWGRITAELLSLKVSLSSEEMPYLSTYYSPCYFFLHIITVLCPHWRSWSLLCPSVPGLCPYFQPFYQPNECGKALCVRPDMMELDELYEFPEFSRDPTMYLALRNLILASWHKNCKVQQSQKWPLGSFKISNKGEKDHSESPMFL